ncbi:MAG: hypothetical protein AAFQ43_03810 [Bacteroidota bacterium]
MKHLTLLLFGLLLAGCESPAAPEAAAPNPFFEMGTIEYGLSDIPMEADEAARVARLDREMEAVDALVASTDGVARSDWQGAASRMRVVLGDVEDARTREKLEQKVAAAMLRVWLDVEAPTAEQREAIAGYTRTLVQHRSPETGIIVRGMDRSGAAMPEAERSDLAAQTLAALADREARLGEACRGCKVPEVAATLEDTGAPTARLRQIAASAAS